jgi:hypothetical protein
MKFPFNTDLLILIRNPSMSKERYEELKSTSVPNPDLPEVEKDQIEKQKEQIAKGIQVYIDEIDEELENMQQEIKTMAKEIASTIPAITAAAATPFGAPNVPSAIKAFIAYVAGVVRAVANFLKKINIMCRKLTGKNLLELVQVLTQPGNIPDWGSEEFAGAGVDIIAMQAEADALKADSDALAEQAADASRRIEDNTGELEVDWAFLTGNTTVHDNRQTIATPGTPTFVIQVVDLPGTITAGEWTAVGVSTPPTTLWDFELKIFNEADVDKTSVVTWDCKFVPAADYADSKEGEWRIGFLIPATVNAASFASPLTGILTQTARFYPKGNPTGTPEFTVEKKITYKIKP